jgi:hypothetical protein
MPKLDYASGDVSRDSTWPSRISIISAIFVLILIAGALASMYLIRQRDWEIHVMVCGAGAWGVSVVGFLAAKRIDRRNHGSKTLLAAVMINLIPQLLSVYFIIVLIARMIQHFT